MLTFNLPFHSDASHYFERLCNLTGCVWLHSGGEVGESTRYDILTALPSAMISAPDAGALKSQLNERLRLDALNRDMTQPSRLPFTSGWIGFLAYQFNHPHFSIPKRRELGCGDCWFGWYDWALVQDRLEQRCYLVIETSCNPSTRALIEQALVQDPEALEYQCDPFQCDEPKSRYMDSLARIQDHLLSGDCYQINYTQRFSASFRGSYAGAFNTLRRAVPSPFSAYLRLPSGPAVMSISPERFIQVIDGEAVTQPIKGTAPRSTDPAIDALNRRQLQLSEKNRAENVMIVDLLRNDFSRLCEPSSVTTPALCQTQSFANVHHLVSTVRGQLRPHISDIEFVLSCFPGGSITGAPKKRAMQIIDDLELHSRSVYCGSIGYITSRRSDFNIAIRTFYGEGNHLYCWGGGGIVADSDAEQEYEESCQKVRALCHALHPVRADA